MALRHFRSSVCLAAVCGLLLAACTPAPAAATPAATAVTRAAAGTLDRWTELFQRTPYPYTTPLPPAEPSTLDGLYVKFLQREATPVHCVRCPDYPVEGGLWKFSLDDGIFRIHHTVTGWRTMGSFTVEGGRLTLFNDPTCVNAVGHYTWELAENALRLRLVDDSCAFGQRARSLTAQPWSSCQPPNGEAAVTSHWPVPEGCDASRTP